MAKKMGKGGNPAVKKAYMAKCDTVDKVRAAVNSEKGASPSAMNRLDQFGGSTHKGKWERK